MSSRIEQIVEVIETARSFCDKKFTYGSISDLRQKAVSRVAHLRGVTTNSIADKFVRQLRPDVKGTGDFDRLLEGFLHGTSNELKRVLLSHAIGADDESRIRNLFDSGGKISPISFSLMPAELNELALPVGIDTLLTRPSGSGTRPGNSKRKLHEQTEILARLVQHIAPLYNDPSLLPSQKQLIETTVGAAIWYLPQGIDLWTGKISLNAAKAYHPSSSPHSPPPTKDHEYPRKVAASELLSIAWGGISNPGAEVLERYKLKYGRFNLVTKQENRSLMMYQRDHAFTDPSQAYKSAGIKLISITSSELSDLKRRIVSVIEQVVARAG